MSMSARVCPYLYMYKYHQEHMLKHAIEDEDIEESILHSL